jgi:hypothetical protein
MQSHAFAYYSSCPDILKGMDCKATGKLLRYLIENLNRDFSANLNPEIIIAENWAGTGNIDITDPPGDSAMENTDMAKHIVLVGASNMTRLSVPSWLSTDQDLAYLA